MATTLATVRDQLETHLSDLTNLIWSVTSLDQAIRSSLGDINHAYNQTYTLKDLDAAISTTLPAKDTTLLITGASAHALTFRVIGRFEEASPIAEVQETLARFATERMHAFQSYLTLVETRAYDDAKIAAELARLTALQNSTDHPYDAWDWEEGTGFS